MKKLLFTSMLFAVALVGGCTRPTASSPATARQPTPPTFSSFDSPGRADEIRAHMIKFAEADLGQILEFYQELSGRSVIRWPSISPNTKISFENTRAMSRVEALQALDTVLAAHNVAMVYLGTRYVKAVPAAQSPQEPGPVVEGPWEQLPESSSLVSYIVKLKHIPPENAVSALQPFAKLPNSIIGVKGNNVIILRDYSANVRRMMQMLETVDVPGTNFWSLPGRK